MIINLKFAFVDDDDCSHSIVVHFVRFPSWVSMVSSLFFAFILSAV